MSDLDTTYLTKEDPKYVDLLDEDSPIAGQKFVCVSFISPEKIIKKRETFLFEEFTKQWDMSKSITVFSKFLQFMAANYNIDPELLTASYKEFIADEIEQLKKNSSETENDFKNFIELNEDKLNQAFNEKHQFATNVRGVKIRGVFASQIEAENHSKVLRKNDSHHDIYVAPCGYWLPWDPTALPDSKIDYLEPELNKLHEEKIKTEIGAKNEFEERIRMAKRAAIEENIKSAKKSGNKLTQTIDDGGNLIGVTNTVDFESREVADSADREIHEKKVYENNKKLSSS
jgi:hypothetical protein